MINALNRIQPSWIVSQRIQAFCTTRQGGISKSPFNSLNLGLNAGDNLADVLQNRSIVRSELPAEPLWLKQIHGVTVSTPASRNALGNEPFEADAAVTNITNEVLAILVADCMPVLFASKGGDVIGAAHAGWRGLSGGILENTIDAMIALSPSLTSSDISAWLGPAIGSSVFEVGEDVLQAFTQQGKSNLSKAFIPVIGTPGKFLADLYLLARDRLRALGIEQITGSEFCTVSDPERFFSYRRDKSTGRFASFIWIAESA
jgi:YfiH family protein